MDVGAVMQEIADRLDTLDGLQVHGYPADSVGTPAAMVTYPGTVTFDATYGRGMDRMDPGVVVLIGKVYGKAARDSAAKWVAGSGDYSIKAVLESGEYTEFDTIRVTQVEFDVVEVARVEYLAATFTLDIAGQGA